MTSTAIDEPRPDTDGDAPFAPTVWERVRGVEAPRGLTLVALILALCFLAGVTGWRVGRGSPPGRDSADVGFLFDMVAHHQQATQIAQLELANGQLRQAKHFAEEVDRFQSYEIGLMDRMLEEWGYAIEESPAQAMAWMGAGVPSAAMPGLASADEMERLRTAGDDTDAVFLALMIDHHAGAVGMAEEAVERANDEDVRELAARMAAAQRFEIRELLGLAKREALDTTPFGVFYEAFDPTLEMIRPNAHDH